VGRVLFVPNQDVAQARIAGQLTVEGQRGAAWVAEKHCRTCRKQRFAGQRTASDGAGAS
jgi:hypothetical protein